MEPTDHELMRRYARGNVDALGTLVERHRRCLYGFILQMTEGREDADGIFQEVWFREIRNHRSPNEASGIRIDESNLDECVLCNLCLEAAPKGKIKIIKLYE